MLGFSVVDPSLQDEAQTKLRLVRYPPTSQLMPILLQPPLPRDPKQCFEYFTSRIAGRETVSSFCTLLQH